jgi:putative flippase GtrA
MTGPTADVARRADGAPDARAELLPALVRFVVVGGLSVSADVCVLFVLHTVLHAHLVLATSVAYFVSLAVNYSLNHTWVFGAEGAHGVRLLRYGLLVAVNYGSTLAFVTGLTAAGLYYLASKAVAVAVNAVMNFTLFRYWVFK